MWTTLPAPNACSYRKSKVCSRWQSIPPWWEWRVILDFLGIKTSYPNTDFQPGSLRWTNHLSGQRWVSWPVWVVQTWLTVPAVSSISSMHCWPSTSTCCKRENKRIWNVKINFRSMGATASSCRTQTNRMYKLELSRLSCRWLSVKTHKSNQECMERKAQTSIVNLQSSCEPPARSTVLTFLYESSIVGSYFSTKIPCTNWTVWKRRCSTCLSQIDTTCRRQRQSEPNACTYISIYLSISATLLPRGPLAGLPTYQKLLRHFHTNSCLCNLLRVDSQSRHLQPSSGSSKLSLLLATTINYQGCDGTLLSMSHWLSSHTYNLCFKIKMQWYPPTLKNNVTVWISQII